MTKFNKLVDSILKEGVLGALGSALGTATTAAGTAINVAKNPAEGLSGLVGDIKTASKKAEEMKGAPYAPDNPPKVGDLAVFADNKEVTGKITTKIDNQGQFGIQLVKPDGTVSEFEFVKTEGKPYWRIDYVNVVTNNHVNGKDLIMKQKDQQGIDILQISPTAEIPYVMVGKNTKFENWIPYKSYLEDQKKVKK